MTEKETNVSPDEARELVRSTVQRINDLHPERLEDEMLALENGYGELPWAWVISVQSKRYVESSDTEFFLMGIGPYLVDKESGEVIPTGSGASLRKLERERGHRAWWDFRRSPYFVRR